MRELEYPFQADEILAKRKKYKRQLLAELEGVSLTPVRIAILGGSTTHDIKDMLELFLLQQGIEPVFYESEYGQYYQDAVFENPDLAEFNPQVVFIHTSSRNILNPPAVTDTKEQADEKLEAEFARFTSMWEALAARYDCTIIQNNFEPPLYRLLGNMDVSSRQGLSNFLHCLNGKFYEYAQTHKKFYINDMAYMAADYGLERWSDPSYWYLYKYCMAVPAIPAFAYNLANIIKAVYGKNKKALSLDLDNTLWGGVVGDDGADGIEIGEENAAAQLYSAFQKYLKELKSIGVLLTVNSKNDEENALSGLARPDSVLHRDDFVSFRANWDNKSDNLVSSARELNIGEDAFVFVDDNPAEREIIRVQVPRTAVPATAVPDIGQPEQYIRTLDRAGYFEVTGLSEDDLKRNEMYQANAARVRQQAAFADYHDYLVSLEMEAEIAPFAPAYMSRIAQLTNKSNQFNLTTKRCSQAEIEHAASDPSCITLYGKLKDKFGDNGVVSVAFGHADYKKSFHIDLWLMSCRVLKRDMEYAMMDELVRRCREEGLEEILGYYYPTKKNGMVREFYGAMGFEKISEDADGNTVWRLSLTEEDNRKHNTVIKVVNGNEQR